MIIDLHTLMVAAGTTSTTSGTTPRASIVELFLAFAANKTLVCNKRKKISILAEWRKIQKAEHASPQ